MYILYVFFFNDTATTEIYTLSLHDALPIFAETGPAIFFAPDQMRKRIGDWGREGLDQRFADAWRTFAPVVEEWVRSEEHTSELQSRQYLVCRLLLEKKK